MNVFRWTWNPAHYWPYGLATVFALFTIRETWALASGRPQDTLSWWVWRTLHVVAGQTPSTASAAWYLTLGGYIVVASWLAFHFWFRRYA